jgi:hypothetical protein
VEDVVAVEAPVEARDLAGAVAVAGAVVVVEAVVELELLTSRMTIPFQFGGPGINPNPVRKFYMKSLLLRRKLYRAPVRGGA